MTTGRINQVSVSWGCSPPRLRRPCPVRTAPRSRPRPRGRWLVPLPAHPRAAPEAPPPVPRCIQRQSAPASLCLLATPSLLPRAAPRSPERLRRAHSPPSHARAPPHTDAPWGLTPSSHATWGPTAAPHPHRARPPTHNRSCRARAPSTRAPATAVVTPPPAHPHTRAALAPRVHLLCTMTSAAKFC